MQGWQKSVEEMLVLFKEKWNGHCLSARELDAQALSLHYSDRIDELNQLLRNGCHGTGLFQDPTALVRMHL